jgi:hypothetical protein
MKLIRLLLTVLLPLTLISCEKDNDPPPAKSKEELLTAHSWKMEELTQVENNTLIYYKRGSSGNTSNYDNDKITFLATGTGTYSPTPAQSFPITWQFTNNEKDKMDITIAFGPGLNVTLKCTELELEDNRFFCVNRFANGSGQPVLASVYRTPL